MIRLYQNKPSGSCYKVRLLFRQVGVAYESVEVDPEKKTVLNDNLIKKLPFRRVPVVELNDGQFLSESNAILLHFAEGTPFVPSDPLERARVFQWMFWEQYDHEPNIGLLRNWAMGSGVPAGREVEAEFRRKRGEEALGFMNEWLAGSSFLSGETYSVADIALCAYTQVAHEAGFSLDKLPAVNRWLEAVKAQSRFFPMGQ